MQFLVLRSNNERSLSAKQKIAENCQILKKYGDCHFLNGNDSFNFSTKPTQKCDHPRQNSDTFILGV